MSSLSCDSGVRISKSKVHYSDCIVLIVCVLSSGLLSYWHGLGTGWDFLDYHYYNGYAFIHQRLGFDLAPAGNWTYYNPLLDSLNYLLISSLPAKLCTFIMGAMCGFIGFFLYKISDLLFHSSDKRWVYVIFSCLIGLTAATIWPGLGSIMNDIQSASFVMLALYLVLKYFRCKAQYAKIFIFVAGLCNGLAPALKLTNSAYTISLLAIACLYCIKDRRLMIALSLLVAGTLLAFLLVEGFWMWSLWKHFANPFFPYFNAVFHSPYFADTNLQADPRWGAHSLMGAIRLIFILTQVNHQVSDWWIRDWRFAAVFIGGLLAGLAALINCLRSIKSTAPNEKLMVLLQFWALAYLIWAFELGNYRFAAPLELLSGPLIVGLYARLSAGFNWQNFGLCILTACIVSQTVYPRFNYSPYQGGAYVSVSKLPKLPANSMIIMTAPLQSFLLPFFPASIRFVNPNAFLSSRSGYDLSKKAMFSEHGPIYILLGDYDTDQQVYWPNWSAKTLAIYRLKVSGPCQSFTSSVAWRGPFRLCPVK
ncbi:MAG: hypothetical protein Q7V63_04325 [Gammaproteobacteria bacterium]|nr:hypothetical protein [Gammaproteobacteria bacterium]